MKRFVIAMSISLLCSSLLAIEKQAGDTTYRWEENISAFGQLLTIDSQKFVGAGFVINGHGFIVTANHVATADTFLFRRIVTNQTDTAIVTERLPDADLAILAIPSGTGDAHFRLGDFFELKEGDSVIYLGMIEDGSMIRMKAPIASIGYYHFDPDGDSVLCLAVDRYVRGGMSGGPVLNARGEAVAVLNGLLIASPSGGDDSVAVIAVSIDYLLKADSQELHLLESEQE